MRKFKILSAIFLFLFSINAVAQKNKLKENHFYRLIEFLSLPNNADSADDIEINLQWLDNSFSKLGFNTSILSSDKTNYFFANKIISKNAPTVLFYMHFDGQPVDSSAWFQDSPYKPVLKFKDDETSIKHVLWDDINHFDFNKKDIRVYARSAADDKGPIVMFLSALHDLKSENKYNAFNIKIILDSEEEKGSPNILKLIKKHTNELSSDYFVVFDGPMHDSGNPTLLYGVRGISTIAMEVYGMNKPQHSGHYGNYGPNSVFRSAEILSSFKNREGKVLISGFYNNIRISDDVLKILNSVPDDEAILKHRAGFKTSEKVGNTYQEAMQFPSLNITGIQAGWTGEQARTIIPDKTIIELDIRTVPESHPDTLVNKIKRHIKNLGYTILTNKATKEDLLSIDKPVYITYKNWMFPFRTNIDSKIGDWLRRAVYKKDKETVQIRISGGSVPLSFFINELKVPTVLVPLVNPDNNQHSPNENLKLSNFFNGIEVIKSILTTPINSH